MAQDDIVKCTLASEIETSLTFDVFFGVTDVHGLP